LLRPIAASTDQVEEAINYVYLQWQQRMRNGTRGEDAPAIVLIIDELMSEAVIGDKEAGHHNETHLAKLSQLASQGIKNNIFLVVGAQDPKIGNTSGLLMRNLGLRYVGHVTDENASRMLAGRGGVNAHLLTGNGDFVRVVDDSLVRFQVAEPTRNDFDRLERQPITVEAVGPVDVIEVPEPSPTSKEEPAPELDLSLLLADSSPAANSGGEPCVDARTLAIYFYDKQLSIAQAREKYGLGRVIHTRHRDFARELLAELKHLAGGRPSRSPYVKLPANQEQE
jgi:DNA segregation ATPase FtsK/SpoIIIE-like protein